MKRIYPDVALVMRFERPFSIYLPKPNKVERSARRADAVRGVVTDIIKRDIVPLLPRDSWWGIRSVSSHGILGYRETVEHFEVEISLPKNDANEELAMLWVLQGKASLKN